MVVKIDEVREVVETLPIGYYCGRKVPVSLSTSDECSSYNPMEDTIVLSERQIKGAINAIPEGTMSAETAIRSNVYHELSHAILTPVMLLTACKQKMNLHYDMRQVDLFAIMNIFEDERIETLLSNFYMGVDFKRNVLMTNGGSIQKATDPMTAFYNLVRFRVGDPALLERVTNTINSYDTLTSTTTDYCYLYIEEVFAIYKDLEKSFKRNPNTSNNASQMEQAENDIKNSCTSDGSDYNGSKNERGSAEKEKNNGGSGKEGEGKGGGKDNADTEGESENSDDKTEIDVKGQSTSKKEGQEGGRGYYHNTGRPLDSETVKNRFSNMTNAYNDSNLTEQLSAIIEGFNKKTNSGNGINAYSGVFDPRATLRDDYKYFIKKTGVNGNNRFGTFHLNLFIDKSGSFSSNAQAVNILLHSLTILEQKNKNFSVDVIFCGDNIEPIKDVKSRVLIANEGNYLDYDDARETFIKSQKSNTINFNIVLFDGDCGAEHRGSHNALEVFDKSNTLMILETDNKKYTKNISSAKIKWLDSGYAEHLTEEVLNALRTAFR